MGLVCFRLREGDAATLVNGRHVSTHRFTRNPIYRVRRAQIPLSKDENTTRSSSNNRPKWLSFYELQFGSLFAPVGIELSKGPKVET